MYIVTKDDFFYLYVFLLEFFLKMAEILHYYIKVMACHLGVLLLTWINLNTSIDK